MDSDSIVTNGRNDSGVEEDNNDDNSSDELNGSSRLYWKRRLQCAWPDARQHFSGYRIQTYQTIPICHCASLLLKCKLLKDLDRTT